MRQGKLFEHSRPARTREIRREMRGNAWQSVGEFEGLADRDLFLFSKGQFSLIDLILACLDQTGPAHVTVSTWTAAQREIDTAARLLREEKLSSMRWLVDFSFCRRQPKFAAQLRERFGDDCIRSSKNHAKFVLIRNDSWSLVIRTSMNLNKNPRFEYCEIGNSAPLMEFFEAVVAEVFEGQAPGDWIEANPYETWKEFDRFGRELVSEGAASPLGVDLVDRLKPGMSII